MSAGSRRWSEETACRQWTAAHHLYPRVRTIIITWRWYSPSQACSCSWRPSICSRRPSRASQTPVRSSEFLLLRSLMARWQFCILRWMSPSSPGRLNHHRFRGTSTSGIADGRGCTAGRPVPLFLRASLRRGPPDSARCSGITAEQDGHLQSWEPGSQ